MSDDWENDDEPVSSTVSKSQWAGEDEDDDEGGWDAEEKSVVPASASASTAAKPSAKKNLKKLLQEKEEAEMKAKAAAAARRRAEAAAEEAKQKDDPNYKLNAKLRQKQIEEEADAAVASDLFAEVDDSKMRTIKTDEIVEGVLQTDSNSSTVVVIKSNEPTIQNYALGKDKASWEAFQAEIVKKLTDQADAGVHILNFLKAVVKQGSDFIKLDDAAELKRFVTVIHTEKSNALKNKAKKKGKTLKMSTNQSELFDEGGDDYDFE